MPSCSAGVPCCSGVPGVTLGVLSGVSGTTTGTGSEVFPGPVSGVGPGVVSGVVSGTVTGADCGEVPEVVPGCGSEPIGPLRPFAGVGLPAIE